MTQTHAALDVLIPTFGRPAALAVTLGGLAAQTFTDFRVVVSDQSPDWDVADAGEVRAVARVLEAHGQAVEFHKHLPRRGMAEQRHFLLNQVQAPHALYLDDDLLLEPWALERMMAAIREEGIGFVGMAPIGLSFLNDERPQQQAIEFWEGPVQPEIVRRGTPQWERWPLHNAANIYHLQQRLGLKPENQRKYKVAWVGACVMFDTAKLRAVGGYDFWKQLPPEHSGEDVVAQQRVMAAYGGCGLIPSGVYHLELPTTVVDRRVDAPKVLDFETER